MMDDTTRTSGDRQAGWLLLLAFAALAAFGIRIIANSDLWIHLAAGRHIAHHGPIGPDPFSFTTASDRVWVNPTWLYDLGLFLLWKVGGATLVTLAHTAAVLAAFALLMPIARRAAGPAAIAAALLLGTWLLAPSFAVGPALPVLLLAALALRLLQRPPGAASTWIALGLVQVVWTNMHSSFLLGPLLALLHGVDAWIKQRQTTPGAAQPARSALFPLAGFLLAITLANPFLLGLHRYAIQAATNANVSVLLEWISPFQGDFAPFAARHISTLVLAVIAIGFVVVRSRLPVIETSLAVLSAFLLVLSPRYFEIAALLAFPFMAMALDAGSAWLRDRTPAASGLLMAAGRTLTLLAAMATLLAICSGYYYNRSGSASGFGVGVAEDLVPQRACALVLERSDFPGRAINLAIDGGYLAWALPERKVFTDTRAAVYGIDFYQGLGRALLGHQETWNSLLDRWQPGAIILNCAWPPAGAVVRRLVDNSQWALVYFDGTTAVLVLRSAANARLVSDLEVQSESLIALETEHRRYAAEVARAMPARNPPQLVGAGAVFLSLWRFAEAETLYQLVTRGSPTYGTGWLNLGICQFHRGAYEESAASLERARRVLPKNVLAWLWLGKACRALGQNERGAAAERRARELNAPLADSFEKGFQGPTNTLPGVSIDARLPTASPR